MDIKGLKNLIDATTNVINAVVNIYGQNEDFGEALRFELSKYMIYLSKADEKISQEEADVISYIYGEELAPEVIKQLITNNRSITSDFKDTIPPILEFLVEADKMLMKQGFEQLTSDVLITTYKEIGQFFMESDNDVDIKEVIDYSAYTEMLEEYKKRNLGL